MIENLEFISNCLPDFVPITKHDSNIVDTAGINLITMHLPALVKMREWRLLFSIGRDGTSFDTFYRLVQDRDNTIVFVQDEHDDVFGAFMVEEWHQSKEFYGSGAGSFVFRFVRVNMDEAGQHSDAANRHHSRQTITDNVEIFWPSIINNRYQASSRDSLTIGSSLNGSCALFISDRFRQGRSAACETFENPPLSRGKDFKIKRFEVWGFDWL